ncbi:VOC family protein [Acinetobacter sp. ANC 4862]|uniref:VOC family protein n=1 Tax=Acinetobacter sp. ANC 4862 TaxID=2529849 RepID=UPI00103E5093|nr:VOC family protein [Acinetobacter sp. ANC 4862]TCH64316.1 VOC family protein [Acinetobacter sp. ANC 4862]
MTHSIYPAFRFKDNTRAVLGWYCSIFSNSQIIQEHETAVKVKFAGVPFVGINGGPSFTTNPSISFMVICESRSEIDYYWNGITLDGTEDGCSWCKDQFGFNWQIVPQNLWKILNNNPYVLDVIFKMKKLSIQDLLQAQ